MVLRVLLWDECDISQMYKNPHNTYTGCQLILTDDWVSSSGSRGAEGAMAPPPGPVKIGHKKDGRWRRLHRFHVSRPPPLPGRWIRYWSHLLYVHVTCMFMLPMHWSVKMLDIIACILQKDHSEMQSCSKVLPRIFYEISWWSHHYTVPTYICIVCDKVCITFIWLWYNRMYMQMCYFDSATSTCVKMFMSSLWTLFGGGNQVLELF